MKELLLVEVAAVLAAGVAATAPPKAHEVEVIAVDYAFQMPRELPAGPTTFRVHNKGKQRHELNIFLLKRGAKINQVLELQTAGKSTRPFVEGPVGVLFAEPGEHNPGGLSTNLLPGREYAVVCIFQDTANAKRHYQMGMYPVIRVQPKKQAAASPVSPRLDTIVGFDYAFRYPKVLAPGKHTFVFKNEGKVRHEFSMVLLKPGVTQAQIAEVDKEGADIDQLIEAGTGLLWSRAGETPLGRLEIDMLPGREYEIICFLSDDSKSLSHFELGMYGTIKVAGSPRSP